MSTINWVTVKEYEDITYKKCNGVARIAFNRPDIRNAFRPKTTFELYDAFEDATHDPKVGVVLLSGEGPSSKDGGWAFCSGGDQNARQKGGYRAEDGRDRLNILEVQRQIRFMTKPVIAVVTGWAVGGGHSLHVVCDLSLASKEHAIFKQTDANVASYDAGYGSAYLARQVGQKRAREIFFLGRNYSAQEAFEMGMVNAVVPHAELEDTAYQWAQEILQKSPMAIRMLKFAFNLIDDGLVGQQIFAGEATRLGYMTEEAQEGRNAFLEKRPPNWDKFERYS
ncbi:1,4-dihydroxy-2-naphthoyl-CoA synthase [Lacihabitans soyangensis]|uniref:1,4-dihydroxy-2-naphthoyl-CoA synthase n=1 Tax=Lacihabitans soyangensis TaxID=869394 RepID=A0AAE3H3B2_9BACT|nr:1,4-dihydroxy-2-naphthoyl-CoA synthase [Lacihabitans soyangensis]MCP9763141.1 1,4-dihydroxy-2-naphthoyl-CoA synthase [Lacihabitans soyangensis]